LRGIPIRPVQGNDKEMSTMADTSITDRGKWEVLFDLLTKEHEGEFITIELLDPEFGAQHQVERLPFAYADYDPRDDVVIVAVGGRYAVPLRHMIWHPSEVSVAPDGAVRVVEQDGTPTLVSFYPTRRPTDGQP
jgi:hypothetical protein